MSNRNGNATRTSSEVVESRKKKLWIALALIVAALAIAAAVRYFTAPGDPDIILVTIDTLRYDCVGFGGNSPVKTPFLDEIARGGIWFENAHAHNVMTLPSHTNILTGLLPYQHGVRDNAGFTLGGKRTGQVAPAAKQKTIAAALRERGYATAAFVAAYPLDSHFGLDEGFDLYDDAYHKASGLSEFATPERPATEVLAAAQKWYEAGGEKKKFLWVHLYEPHHPFEPPSEFRQMYPQQPYYGEVAAVDDALGKFLRPILARNPGTMLVVTSDHGEGLGSHGEQHHGLFAYEATLKVPLILYERGRIRPRVEKSFVRHIDIAPTLLARLNIAKPAEMKGESLLDVQGDRDTYFEALWGSLNLGWAPLVGMIHEKQKYIELPLAELYDLPHDPLEAKNILESDRRMTTRIRELLAAQAPGAAVAGRNVSPEEAKNLLSLGYLTGTAAAKKSYTADDDPKNLVRYHARMQEAVEHYRRGEKKEAVAVAEQLFRERPEMTMARELLAKVLEETQQGAEAEKLLRESVAAGTANDAMKKRLGLMLSEKGDAAEAVRILSAFADSKEPALLNAYGIALADLGRQKEAIAQFERVLQLDPANAVAYQNLGIVALRIGQVDRAGQFLTRALQLDPKLPRALNTLGVVFARRNDYARAVGAWQQAVTLDPRQYDALFNLGMVAGRAGNRDEARKALTQFVDGAPRQRYAREIAAAREALAALR